MYCRICGTEEYVEYRQGKRQALCDSCNIDTPIKVSRFAFDAAYWGKDLTVPENIKREFYADYLSSTNTLGGYIKATCFVVE